VAHDIRRDIPWPYPGNQFPEGVGVVIQRTVIDGQQPALSVVHDEDGDWLAWDGINDPNVPDAAILVCMHHLVDLDPSVAELATMPPGTEAWRDNATDPWTIEEHSYEDDE
jgi:hypothetical protein